MLLRKGASLSAQRVLRLPPAAARWTSRTFHSTQLGSKSISRHLVAFGRATASRAVQSPAASHGRRRLLYALLPLGAGGSAYAAWCNKRMEGECDINDIELPLCAEPRRFTHPYETWPWHQRYWFTLKRGCFLAWVFAPLMCTSAIVLLFPENLRLREMWLDTVLTCMMKAGAAFQKFGQWLSMRPDMFPPDVISVLAKLRCDAPSHPAAVSRSILREQLGHEIEDLFDEFEEEPIASGSVGQVHR